MSKLKNPGRLSRRLGCWDNPSGHKTCQCTPWRITGRRISVTFLIFSAQTETYLENYEWTWFNITISYHPSFASFITLHPFHWQLLQCQVFTLLCLLQHWMLDNSTPYHFLSLSQSQCLPSDNETSPSVWLAAGSFRLISCINFDVMLMMMTLTDVHEIF